VSEIIDALGERETSTEVTPLWLSVEQAAPLIGEKKDAIYRDIREGQFPFEFVKCGKRIKISARSIGLIPAAA
jgi:excisionase family DNA binding protein